MAATDGRVAIVTGGAHRIGRAIALDLAAHGYTVAVSANGSADGARATVEEIGEAGGTAEAFIADLTVPGAAERLVSDVASRFGPPSLLVNNASIFEADTAEAFDPDLFDRHMAIHVKAPAALTAAMAQHLPEGADGLVVNMIDQRVWRLTPGFFSYTLSKAALWTATQTMAMAYAPRIRVNAIGPGPTLRSPRQSDEDFRRQSEAVPLEKGPELTEFGSTIRYLDAARSITGQMIALDGGQHLAWLTPDVANMNE